MSNRIFYDPDQYIEQVDKTHGRKGLSGLNCLAFAFGDTKPDMTTGHYHYTMLTHDPDGIRVSIEYAFGWECTKRGITVEKVKKAEPGHYYFRVYGWYSHGDFHVMRQEPDGTLVHKLGWQIAPTVTSEEALHEEYPERYVLYKVISY